MNKPILTAALFACAIFAAQAAEPYSDCDSVRFEDFRHIDLNDFEPTTYPYAFIEPSHLQIVNDSTLAYADAGSSPLVRILNVETGDCMAYINAGFGEYDMASARSVSFTDSILSVYDALTHHFARFKHKSGLEFEPIGWLNATDVVWRMVQTDENHCIWSGNAKGEKLFYRIDLTTGEATEFGDIPLVPHDDDAEPDENVMQGMIAFDPGTRRFVSAIMSWDIISIYDADNLRLIKRLRGPLFIDSRVVIRKLGDVFFTKGKRPTKNSFLALGQSKSGFSVGICEDVCDEEHYYNPVIASIACYSWDGEPQLLIHLAERTIDYACDIDRNLLFMLTKDDNDTIQLKKYDLSKPRKSISETVSVQD